MCSSDLLCLHLANCALVALLAYRCTMTGARNPTLSIRPLRPTIAAFGAMMAYALHPALIESVAWISGRFDLMVTMFSLLALFLSTRADRKPSTFAIATLVLLALLSKEMAITLPILILLFRAAFVWDDQQTARR